MEVAISGIMLVVTHFFTNMCQISIKRRLELPAFIFYYILLERFVDKVSYNNKLFIYFGVFHMKFENLLNVLVSKWIC
jgi:hypothetical protein